MLLQQPDGGKTSGARGAAEHLLPEESRMHEALQEGGGQRRKGQHEGRGRSAAVGARRPVQVRRSKAVFHFCRALEVKCFP